MLKNIKIVFCFFLLTLSTLSFAQYGYGNGYGNNGMGRSQIGSNMPSSYSKSEADIEKERAENLNKTVEKLKTDLQLDDLQLFVIRKELETSSASIYKIIKSESTDEEKTTEIEAITERTDRNINGYLNEEQKKKYKLYVEERKERFEKIKTKRARK